MEPFTKLQLPAVEDRLFGPNPVVSLNATYYAGQRVAYGRHSNSTWEAFEALMGELEGGTAVCFASGQAAMFATSLLATGAVAMAGDCYVGSRDLAGFLAAHGIRATKSLSEAELAAPERISCLAPGDLVMVESPSNPDLATYDLAAIAAAAHRAGARVAVDNTVATPILQNPLALGADLVVHSATKFISGHSDVLAGVVVAREDDAAAQLFGIRELVGSVLGPVEAYLCLRGAKTLGVRVRAASETAQVLASRLLERLGREAVRYPGFDERLVGEGRQQRAGGALLSLVLASAEEADAFVDELAIFHHATSLGGVESLAERRGKYTKKATEHRKKTQLIQQN
jgi:cystathionine gamma-synthase